MTTTSDLSALKEVSNIDLNKQIIFSQAAVKNLKTSDFQLNCENKITLRTDMSLIVLFYINNTESLNIAKLWLLAAQQAGGGQKFGACNLEIENDVDEAFKNLNMDPTHPYAWASLKSYPFILTYRQGRPVAFYNGERSTNAFVNYALTLAFNSGYFERNNVREGVSVDNDFAMTGFFGYKNPPVSQSKDFKSDVSLTGYNQNEPVYRVGTTEETKVLEGGDVVKQNLESEQTKEAEKKETVAETPESGEKVTTPASPGSEK